jgi:signal transduction histidine kinase
LVNRTYREEVDSELTRRRERIVRALLLGLAVLGVVAYVPSLWVSLQVGAYGIAIVDTVVYAALLWLLAFAGGRTRLQSAFLVVLCFGLGLILSIELGPFGAGAIWLGIVPAITAVLFGLRATYVALAAVFLTAVAVAVAAVGGLVDWGPEIDQLPLWVVQAGNGILVGGGVALAVGALVRGLREVAENHARVTVELDRERERLLEANAGLEREATERREAEQQLRQAEKLTAIGTLAAGIAHDFNNLLTPVLAAPDVLRDESLPADQRERVLERVEEAALAGKELVRRILSFSRPTDTGRAPLDAPATFREALRLLRASLPASISLESRIDPAGHVRLEAAEIHQLVLNLGSNAQKAMPEGGRLAFRLDEVPSESVAGWTADPPPERLVRIRIEDSGTGMDEETLQQVFDPFFTTDKESGTGMGLATVHGIVTSAGGLIQCESEPGEGTTFTLYLPVVEPDPIETAAPVPATPAGRSDQHLLLVDDEEAVRGVSARALRRKGYQVTAVPDANAALAVLDETPGISAVITDLNMPGMRGTLLARAVREQHPDIGIILFTGLADRALEEEAREMGIDRIIAKPFRVHELVDAIREVLAPES